MSAALTDVGGPAIFVVVDAAWRGARTRGHAFGDWDGEMTENAVRERVLVVDDEAPVRALIHRTLADAGYEVIAASNGREALALAAEVDGGIDLLVSDVVMPELGGRELAERLLADHPGLAVLFLSGYSGAAVKSYGVFDMDAVFCAKPVRPAMLREKAREALDARGAQDD